VQKEGGKDELLKKKNRSCRMCQPLVRSREVRVDKRRERVGEIGLWGCGKIENSSCYPHIRGGSKGKRRSQDKASIDGQLDFFEVEKCKSSIASHGERGGW